MFLELHEFGVSNSATENSSRNHVLIPTASFHASRNELLANEETVDQKTIVSMAITAGRITYATEIFCKITGYPLDKLVGMKVCILNSSFHNIEFKEGASFEQLFRIAIGNGQYLDLPNDPHPQILN